MNIELAGLYFFGIVLAPPIIAGIVVLIMAKIEEVRG